MKIAGKSVGIIAGIFGLIIIVPYFVNFSDYAKPYLIQAKQQAGLEISTGSVRLQILPTPRLVVYDVVVANKNGALHSNMLQVKAANVVLSLGNLLVGRFVVEKVVLDNSEINLEKDINGKGNWEIELKQDTNNANDNVSSGGSANVAAAGLLVKNLYINSANVTYADRKANTIKKLDSINLQVNAEALLGPYHVNAELSIAGAKVAFRSLVGPMHNEHLPLLANVSAKFLDANLQSEIKGSINIQNLSFVGALVTTIAELPFRFDLPNKQLDFSKKLNLSAKITANSQQIKISACNLNSDFAALNGAIAYDLEKSKLDADFSLLNGADNIQIEFTSYDLKNVTYKISASSYQEFLKWFITDNAYQLNQKLSVIGTFVNTDNIMQFKQTEINLRDASAQLNINFAPDSKKLLVQGIVKSVEKWGAMFKQELPLTGNVNLNVQLLPQNDSFNLKAVIASNNGSFSFDGIVLDKNVIARGNLSAKQFKLADYNVDLGGAITVNHKQVDLDLQRLRVSNSSSDFTAKAKLKIDTKGEKPHISGSIAAQPIQLTAYNSNIAPKILPAILYNDFVDRVRLTAANLASRWRMEPIGIKLDSMTVDLNVDIPKLTVAGLALEHLKTTINLKNAKLSVPVSADLYGGKIEVNLQVSSENTLKVALNANLNGVNVAGIQAAKSHFKKGEAFGKINVKSFGGSQHELVQNLNGSADFALKDGIIKGFDLSQMVKIAKKPLNLINPKALEQTFSGEGETAFKEAAATFNIKGGVANTSNLKVDANDAKIQASGDIDILNWRMVIKGIVNVPVIKDFPAIGFKINGSLDHPNYHIDTKALGKLFLQQGGDALSKVVKGIPGLDKIIPSVPSNANQPSEPSVSQSAKPEKVVKNIIKGIFG
jgi:uncharacterized protein involved in outer membrane biogenesis